MRSVLSCSWFWEFALQMSKLCFHGASAAVCLLMYTSLVAFFALVGGTLGAVAGSLIGLKSQSRFIHGAAIGTIVGVLSSVELLKISVAFLLPEGNRFCMLGPLFDSATVRVARKLVQECYNPAVNAANVISEDVSEKRIKAPNDSDKKILKTRIARNDLFDSSGNRVCCPICLEDFESRQEARKLSCCHHLFHQPCIDKWLRRHDSCPLCRCIVTRKKLGRV